MNKFFDLLKISCEKYKIVSLQKQINALAKLEDKNKIIDIAILGQFKSGKSSFINSFIGKSILPVGVIPITSIVTRLEYGEKEKANIIFLDGKEKEVDLDEIAGLISETENPENKKNVLFVDIEIPELKPFIGLRFVDTPGMGSIFKHNTEASLNWFPEIGVAIMVVSAERPLSENEINLLKEIIQYTPKVIILLSKTDLFNERELNQLSRFIKNILQKEFKRDFEIYQYSIYKTKERFNKKIREEIILPIKNNIDDEYGKIAEHKLNSLAESVLGYLEVAYAASLKTDFEKEKLKDEIIDECLNSSFIEKELFLIKENHKEETREKIFKILSGFEKNLIIKLDNDFQKYFSGWKGNLFKLSRKYEEWIENILSEELSKIILSEDEKFRSILDKVRSHFSFYAKSFRERINENIQKVLGIKIPSEEWDIELNQIEKPDISVYTSFDFHLDLLFFLFPMFIYKNIFLKYFNNKIPGEVDKNIRRLTSDITEEINKEIENCYKLTLIYISEELETIETVLLKEESNTKDYEEIIESIKYNLKEKV